MPQADPLQRPLRKAAFLGQLFDLNDIRIHHGFVYALNTGAVPRWIGQIAKEVGQPFELLFVRMIRRTQLFA